LKEYTRRARQGQLRSGGFLILNLRRRLQTKSLYFSCTLHSAHDQSAKGYRHVIGANATTPETFMCYPAKAAGLVAAIPQPFAPGKAVTVTEVQQVGGWQGACATLRLRRPITHPFIAFEPAGACFD
jgi:hypothetical protein